MKDNDLYYFPTIEIVSTNGCTSLELEYNKRLNKFYANSVFAHV